MFPTINKKETGVNLRRIMDMRGVKPKDIQEYLGFGCVQSVYRWLDGVSMPTVDNLYAIKVYSKRIGKDEYAKEYKLQEWNGGKVWVEEAYPNILFAKDGEIYDIAGMKTIVIGGAYSVDKFYRLSKGYNWFEDEQPSDEIKAYVEKQLSNNDWNVDVVLSHTVPYDYRPVDLFLSMIDQSTVDESTELWLGEIEKKLDYKWWYAGHYHTSRVRDKVQIMFEDIEEFLHRKLDYQ